MSGTKISDMPTVAESPSSGMFAPVVIDEVNYKYDVAGPITLIEGWQQNGIVLDSATVVANAFTRIVLDQPAPTSGMINSQGGNDAVNMRIIQNMGRLTQGPTVQPNYFDTVIAFGFNMTGSFTPLNTAMPSGSYRIESKFAQGTSTSPFMSEYHMASHFATDWSTAGEYRAVTATVPHQSADWDSYDCSVGQRGAIQINFDWDNNIRIYADYTTAGGGVIDYSDGGSGQGHPILRFNTNNKVCFRQIDAAGSALLDLPYYDSNNALTTTGTGTLHLNGPVQTVGWLGAKAGLAVNIASGAVANTQLMNFTSYGAVTGSMGGVSYEASASVKVESTWINGTSGGKNGLKFRTSNGDSYIEFRDETNARQFTWNYVASGAYYELNDAQQGGQFASKYAIRVDWTKFQVVFGYAPKLPKSAVGGLPAAATAGEGVLQYVDDLNSTTTGAAAAGGGTNKGFVGSDGTGWHIVAAWA